MTAYAAVISLMHTILHLLRSHHIWVVPGPSQKIIESTYRHVQSLQEILLKLDSSRSRSMNKLNTLDAEIREVVYKFQDLLESHIYNQLLSQNEERNGDESHLPLVHIVLQDLEQDSHFFAESLNNMTADYIAELDKSLSEEEEEEEDVHSFTESLESMKANYITELDKSLPEEEDFSGKKSKIIGLSDKRLRTTLSEISHRGTTYYRLKRLKIIQLYCELQQILEEEATNFGGKKSKIIELSDQLRTTLSDLSHRDTTIDGEKWSKVIGLHDQLRKILEEEEEATNNFGGKKSKIIGLSDELRTALSDLSHRDKNLVSLVGMAGIGKTTVVNETVLHPSIQRCYDIRVWVTVGRKPQLKHILLVILSQLDPNEKFMGMGRLTEIVEYLKEKLKKCEGFLIVLDDLWDIQVVHDLERLLHVVNRIDVFLITTRLQEVAKHAGVVHTMQFLSKEDSWDLLCNEVFGEEVCPPQLEEIGKKIAEKCEGLPLTIVTVADLLSKVEKTPEYWSKVAERKAHPIFIAAYEKISKVIYPSYEHLTQHLKMCFLYVGVFPQSYEIHKSKLITLWFAEGFFEQNIFQTSENYVEQSLRDLVSNNLVMLSQECFILGKIKTCKVHTSVWYLCNKVARKNKFFHVLSDCADGLEDRIRTQRRLCMHSNILLGINKVHNLREDNCTAFTLRSFLCFGPYHQYPLPICSGLRLLRVFDAITIRFYEFPMKLLQLVLLRYLALTCHGRLPPSISKLSNLQFLIVSRHLNIKLYRALSPLPMEIWELKQLKHLQVTGSDLQDPTGNFIRPNFSTLLDVSPHSCTKSVFERIPNLNKLRIQIELAPDQAVDELLCCFDNICHLKELESLKCVVVNPYFRPDQVVSPLVPLSVFSLSLKKFCLSGLGYPWEEMSKINASLPNLEVLKLVCNAFRGPKWEMEAHGFLKLKHFLIEDSDLVQWKVGVGSFPSLKLLSIRHCYKLREIHGKFDKVLRKIEVVDCNPSAVTCLKQTKDVYTLLVVHSSWLEERK